MKWMKTIFLISPRMEKLIYTVLLYKSVRIYSYKINYAQFVFTHEVLHQT